MGRIRNFLFPPKKPEFDLADYIEVGRPGAQEQQAAGLQQDPPVEESHGEYLDRHLRAVDEATTVLDQFAEQFHKNHPTVQPMRDEWFTEYDAGQHSLFGDTSTEGATLMSNNIANIVTTSMRNRGLGHYASQAAPVIADIEEAADRAVAILREQGVRLGATEGQIEAVLIQSGLVAAPEPEPVVAASGSGMSAEVLAAVERIEARMNTLESAARRYGVRV